MIEQSLCVDKLLFGKSHSKAYSSHNNLLMQIKMASPKSPKDKTGTDTKDSSAVRFLDFKEMKSPTGRLGINEKEAARQAWLDRERDREVYTFLLCFVISFSFINFEALCV